MSNVILDLRSVSSVYAPRGLVRRSGGVVAVDDVSLSLAHGEILALVGESGAGKSTIGQLVLGLRRPTTGAVLFEGVDLATLSGAALRRARRRMHLILQDPYESLHPGMRVRELVAEPLIIGGVQSDERKGRVIAALEEVDLVPAARFMARFPHELSGGQRQRVAIARALVGKPRLVVADEPTSMLDVSLRLGILELLLQMRDHLGTAFVFITHDLATARHVSNRIAVMHRGRVVETGDTDKVIANPQEDYTKTLLLASEGILGKESGIGS